MGMSVSSSTLAQAPTRQRGSAIRVIKYALFSASIVPSFVGAALAYHYAPQSFNLLYAVLAGLGLFLGQMAGDYFYYYGTHFHSDARDAHTKIFAGWKPLYTDAFLGDRGTLHPHWVHLHRGGRDFSPTWQGEFFLTSNQASQAYTILLETMQVVQSTNQLFINGVEITHLQARPRPDITSTWVTQRFNVPASVLHPGVNTLSIAVGPRGAARQYLWTRWENMQFRNIRLVTPTAPSTALLSNWQPQPTPGGWRETNRLRPGLNDDLWLTGIRPSELWHSPVTTTPIELKNQAANRPNLIFNDVLPTHRGELAATNNGLFWRAKNQSGWQPIAAAPTGHAYVVVGANQQFYAGYENDGLWSATSPTGPWQRTTLTATTVVDLTTTRHPLPHRPAPVERLYAISKAEVFANNGLDSNWQLWPLPGLSIKELDEAGESPGDKFRPRLYPLPQGKLLVRNHDRLWLQSSSQMPVTSSQKTQTSEPKTQNPEWELFGPEHLHGKLLSVLNCCGPGTLAGTNDAGIWQLTPAGQWQRVDKTFFNTTDATELRQVNGQLFAAGDLGLFQSGDGGNTWQKVEGLPPTVSDLLVDPANPSRWLAGTPAGLYRSPDSGQSWQSISPPWTVWDMALGPQGRLFVGRSKGLAWADDLSATPIQWQTTGGLEKVYFLRVNPHPAKPQIVWTGTWGNNIGMSNDGGQTIEPLHNGLETLSGLDILWHPTPGQVTLATIEGLYRTDDGGQSWFKLPGPLARQTIYALLQTDDGAIWAGAANGLWRSQDYGSTWQQVGNLPQATVLRLGKLSVPPPPLPFHPPLLPQQNKAKVYAPHRWLWAGTEGAGLWVSRDSGASWQFAGLPERSVYNIFFDPLQPRRLIVATDRGIFAARVPEQTILSSADQPPG